MLVVILPSGSIGGFPPFRLVKFKPQIYGFFPKFNDGTNHMNNGYVLPRQFGFTCCSSRDRSNIVYSNTDQVRHVLGENLLQQGFMFVQ